MTFTYPSTFCRPRPALKLSLILEIKADGYGTSEMQKKHSPKNHDLLLMGQIRLNFELIVLFILRFPLNNQRIRNHLPRW
ncbi:hypothetical protein Golob_020355 [Gossypium lobatum]|uniref:Uncharacterized protein n=1 Tax=Gossypium lobatum TaxID=34289 RepID=A0A7J8LAB9_9ROSI|nr:hypothetical protein [Gossypium lobatum]